MKLSNQALNALMMALQKSLLEQSDIVPILRSFEFTKSPTTKRWGQKEGELSIKNPPNFTMETLFRDGGPNSNDNTTSGSD
jgi:hypothetical protein